MSPHGRGSVINFAEKLAKFSEHWSPRVVAEMNDYQFKLVKFQGEFVWHDHKETERVSRAIGRAAGRRQYGRRRRCAGRAKRCLDIAQPLQPVAGEEGGRLRQPGRRQVDGWRAGSNRFAAAVAVPSLSDAKVPGTGCRGPGREARLSPARVIGDGVFP